jgi:uncharacterized protein (DUF433 family)
MPAILNAHVETETSGVPMISGTNTKVIEVALDRLAHHWDAEEIRRQHPHLTLSQIYSALAYYHDHQAEMDFEIQQRLENVRQIAVAQPESLVRAKLKALGRMP